MTLVSTPHTFFDLDRAAGAGGLFRDPNRAEKKSPWVEQATGQVIGRCRLVDDFVAVQLSFPPVFQSLLRINACRE